MSSWAWSSDLRTKARSVAGLSAKSTPDAAPANYAGKATLDIVLALAVAQHVERQVAQDRHGLTSG